MYSVATRLSFKATDSKFIAKPSRLCKMNIAHSQIAVFRRNGDGIVVFKQNVDTINFLEDYYKHH
jgi:hypothetical protein